MSEKQPLLAESTPQTPTVTDVVTPAPAKTPMKQSVLFFWILVNCFATLGIVLVNKSIFITEHFKKLQTLFVAYHFALTGLTMYVVSLPAIGWFQRKPLPWLTLAPLSISFGTSTIVTNISLALLDIPIYQELRVLITPVTVIINLVLYGTKISQRAAASLVVVCVGVSYMLWADAKAKAIVGVSALKIADQHKNTLIGYACGIGGVTLSGLYTVWIGRYHEKLSASSMQLLLYQAPLASAILLVASPFFDTFPIWSSIPSGLWLQVLGSGSCAVLINISQFYIIAGSSAVASTVVGHAKTCLIVAVGWMMARSAVSLQSWIGIGVAMGAIFWYAHITLEERRIAAQAKAASVSKD